MSGKVGGTSRWKSYRESASRPWLTSSSDAPSSDFAVRVFRPAQRVVFTPRITMISVLLDCLIERKIVAFKQTRLGHSKEYPKDSKG